MSCIDQLGQLRLGTGPRAGRVPSISESVRGWGPCNSLPAAYDTFQTKRIQVLASQAEGQGKVPVAQNVGLGVFYVYLLAPSLSPKKI